MTIPVNGTPEFSKLYKSLNKTDKILFKEIDNVLESLSRNPKIGDMIRFKQIPKSLKKRYNIDNLFRVEINQNWRLLYP